MNSPSNPRLPDVPPVLYDEERIGEIRKTGLLAEETVENFDRLTRQAAEAVGAPAGFVSLLTEDGQFLRGCVGLPEPLNSTRKTPIEHSICAYTLDRTEPLVINDVAADPDLGGHPAVEEYGIEAYLGVPLITSEDRTVGTFCVVEWEPRPWTDEDVATVEDFAASARTEIELRLELRRREELESQLQARTEAFEALVGNITDVVTVLDADGTIQFESPSATEVLGHEPHELEGTSLWECVHPDDRAELKQNMDAALTDPDRRPTVTFRFRHADGDWRMLESRSRRLPEEADLGTLISVSRDVTERRRLEERVRLLANAVERAETGVVITGPNLDPPGPKIQYVNEAMAEMTGYDEEEMLGSTPRMFQGPDTSREKLDRLKRRLPEGKTVVDEVVNYEKDGSPYHVRWRIAPITNEEGDTTHFVSVQEDITAEKEREQELERRVKERTRELRAARDEAERAERLKSALLTNMSHEVRTPLTSIIGFAQSIGEAVEDSDQDPGLVARFAGLIEKSGRRLRDTLGAVLNLSKLEAGEMDLAREPVDVARELDEAAELFELEAEEARLTLTVDTPDTSLWAWADPDGLQVVLKNLLSNAVKFTDSGGRIDARARTTDDTVTVEIEDTGIGMDPAEVPSLFKAFKQASEGVGREYEGTGLGLAVTKEAIDQMSGSIEVETEKDEGTCFTVRLPRAAEQDAEGS
jgi:PAS domain S-box-containing protein